MPDNRVVSFIFDNKDFLKKIAETKNGLQELDKDLNFDKSLDKSDSKISQFFSKFQSKIKETNMDPITNSVDKVVVSFNKFDAVVTGIFLNLGRQIEEFGVKMVKNLTLDQAEAGFNKYEQILKSTQTILATDPNLDQSKVNEYLDQLIWYTDETSYAMTDMVSNISTFTNMGIPLESAVQDMIGIGNAAAMAGASVDQASHAMVGFSRAMGRGYMEAGVWNTWIKTANIGTMEFKKRAIEAAKEMGILYEKNGKLYSKYDTGEDPTEVTAENFSASLTTGKWFTNDVMEKVLHDYSKSINEIYKKYEDSEGRMSTSEILEKYGDQLDKFSTKAFMLGQEATTFTQAVDSLFDAMSSRWVEIWTLIFGDYEEARKLWTDLANWLYDTFVTPIDYILDVIDKWSSAIVGTEKDEETGIKKEITAHDALIQSFKNILDVVTQVSQIITEAFSSIFGSEIYGEDFLPKRLVEYTKKFLEFTESLSLTDETGEKLSEKGKKLKDTFTEFFGIFGTISDFIKPVITEIKNIFSVINESSNLSVLDTLYNIFAKIHKILSDNLYPIIPKVKTVIDKMALSIASFVKNNWPFVKSIVKNVFSIVKQIAGMIKSILMPLFNSINSSAEHLVKGNIITNILSFISNLTDKISKLISVFSESKVFTSFIEFISKITTGTFSGIFAVLDLLSEKIGSLFNSGALKTFSELLKPIGRDKNVTGKAKDVNKKGEGLGTGSDEESPTVLEKVATSIEKSSSNIKSAFSDIFDIIFGSLASLVQSLSQSGLITQIIDFVLNSLEYLISKVLTKIDILRPEIFSILTNICRDVLVLLNSLFLTVTEFIFNNLKYALQRLSDLLSTGDFGLGKLIKVIVLQKIISHVNAMINRLSIGKILAFAAAIGIITLCLKTLTNLDVNSAKQNVGLIINVIKELGKVLIQISALTNAFAFGGPIAVNALGKGNVTTSAQGIIGQLTPILMILAMAEAIKIIAKAVKALGKVDDLDTSVAAMEKIFYLVESAVERIMVIFYGFNILMKTFSKDNSFNYNKGGFTFLQIGKGSARSPLFETIKSLTIFVGVVLGAFIALLLVVKNIYSIKDGPKILDSAISIFNSVMTAIMVLIMAMGIIIAMTMQKASTMKPRALEALSNMLKYMLIGMTALLAAVFLIILAVNGKNIDVAKLGITAGIIAIVLGTVALLLAIIDKMLVSTKGKKKYNKLLKSLGKLLLELGGAMAIMMLGLSFVIKSASKGVNYKTLLALVPALIIIFGVSILLLEVINGMAKTNSKADTKNLNKIAKAFTEISISMAIISVAISILIRSMNGVPVENFILAVLGLGVIMMVIAGILKYLSESFATLNPKGFLQIGAAFMAISFSLVLIALAMSMISKALVGQEFSAVALVLGTMIGALVAFSLIFVILSKLQVSNDAPMIAASFVIMAAAMLIIAMTLGMLTKIASTNGNFKDAVMAVYGIMAAFLILGIVAAIAQKGFGVDLGAIMISMGAGFLVFAAACIVLAIALDIFTKAFEKFINIFSGNGEDTRSGGGGGITSIQVALENFISLLPYFGEIIVFFITSILTTIINVITSSLYTIAKGVIEFFVNLIVLLGENAPRILEALKNIHPLIIQILTNLLDIIFTVLSQGMGRLMMLIHQFLLSLWILLPDVARLLDGLIDLVLGRLGHLISTICKLVKEKIPEVVDTFLSIIDAIIKGLRKHISEWTKDLIGILTDLIDNIAKGISQVSASLRNLLITIVDEILNMFETAGEVLTKLQRIPRAILNGILKGLKNSKASDGAGAIGKDLVDGLLEGIKSKIKELASSASGIAKTVLNTMCKVFDINSPSGETEWVGIMSMKGLFKGLTNKKENKGIMNSISSLKEKVTGALDFGGDSGLMSGLIDNIQNMLGDMDFTSNLNLNPVVDMDALSNGFNMNGMINTDKLASGFSDSSQAADAASAFASMQTSDGTSSENQNGTGDTYNVTTMQQNNYSPKAIDSATNYRQTNNLINASLHDDRSNGFKPTNNQTAERRYIIVGGTPSRRIR